MSASRSVLLLETELSLWLVDWLSMVLRLHQHNIGYTADGFYRSDDPTNSVKALKEGGYHSDRPQSNQAHLTVLQ